MPAVSKAQRRMAGAVMEARQRGMPMMGGGMMNMSMGDLKTYAGTPEKGLPMKVKGKGKKKKGGVKGKDKKV